MKILKFLGIQSTFRGPSHVNEFLFLQKFRNESMSACLEIFSLSVSHKARGLGIGALLCNHVEKLAKEQNVDLYLGKYDKLSAELTQFVNMATVMLVTCYHISSPTSMF